MMDDCAHRVKPHPFKIINSRDSFFRNLRIQSVYYLILLSMAFLLVSNPNELSPEERLEYEQILPKRERMLLRFKASQDLNLLYWRDFEREYSIEDVFGNIEKTYPDVFDFEEVQEFHKAAVEYRKALKDWQDNKNKRNLKEHIRTVKEVGYFGENEGDFLKLCHINNVRNKRICV